MDFAPGLVKVTLRPRPGCIPKVLSTSFRSQVVTLHSFHPPPFASSEDERLHMLCPVRALKLYVDCSKVWRKSSQLLVCFGSGRRGLATSKQRFRHRSRKRRSQSVKSSRSVSFPIQRTRVTRVTRDVICMHQGSESNAISILCMCRACGRIDNKADFVLP